MTSSSGSSTPYPSSIGTSSSGVGQSCSSSDVDSPQVETTPVPAVQTMPQLETSKEGTYEYARAHTHTKYRISLINTPGYYYFHA